LIWIFNLNKVYQLHIPSSMKTTTILAVLLALSTAIQNVYAQSQENNRIAFDELGKQWARYEKEEIDNNLFKVSHRYFTETVSVKEMREAFYKYKDQQFMKSPYEGFDSIHSLYADAGESVMLLSPLKSHPRKEIRGCRVIWESSGIPKQIIDNSGKKRADLLEKLKSSRKDWLNGDYLALREPRWYMGFAVSPVAYLDTFDNENYVRAPFASSPDFFSYASNHLVLDGEWYHGVGEGARRIGKLHAQNTSKHDGVQEKSFSVLLFTKAERDSPLVSYSLELLEPESPDDVTKRLFEDFKHFVERIPSKAFAPYFTTDMRLMTGRYYKVTVNKGGWLVEDYIDFSQTQEVDWPTFPGGSEAMQAFIQKEMIYPAEAKNNKEQGNVVVLCRIDAQGNIVKSKVARSVSPSLDREALRIVSKMPQFVPRKNKYGKTFETPSWTLVIPFILEENENEKVDTVR